MNSQAMIEAFAERMRDFFEHKEHLTKEALVAEILVRTARENAMIEIIQILTMLVGPEVIRPFLEDFIVFQKALFEEGAKYGMQSGSVPNLETVN